MLYYLVSFPAHSQINYTFTTTGGTYTAVSGSTRIVDANENDDLSSTTNIGFDFIFGCQTYTQFKASSNGWMSLGNAAGSSMATNNLSNTGNGPIIAPLWDDLRAGSAGVVYTRTGTAPNRILTVEWSAMRWNRNASGSVVSFQAKLYETTNVIEFIYYQNSNPVNSGSASIGISGGNNSGDFYSVNGINGGAIAIYGTETNNHNQRPGFGRVYRWTPQYGVNAAVTTQPSTAAISLCNNIQQMIGGVQIVTQACSSPLNTLTEFKINMTGSTAISDVTGIHIYYTGTTNGYAAINEFGPGTITPAAGTITVTGSQLLATGVNYFWIAYDVSGSAVVGNVLDMQCTEITVDGIVRTLAVSSPAGSLPISSCPVSPGGINGASFWVKSNAGTSSSTNNTLISTWNDQSGNNRHASNSDADNQPRYYDNATKNVNFNPVVDFDEASQEEDDADFLDIPGNGVLSAGNNPYEVYAVLIPGANNLTTPGKWLFAGQAGNNNFNSFDVRSNYSINDSWNLNDLIATNMWAVDSVCMLTFDYNYIRRQAYKSGTSIGIRTSSAVRTSPNTNNAIGCQRSANLEYYDGGIAEIITYANTSHSTAAREKVQSYLAIKYGITLSHNYKSSAGNIVWNRSLNAAYNNNIIGVARDDVSNLSQKQSKSTSGLQDILTVYIGGSKEVNQVNNSGTFANDQSFFMVGTNRDHPLDSWPSTTEKPSGICCRILREWMVQKSNFNTGTITLEFDFNSITTGYLPLNVGDLRLLVDNDGNFGNATILNSPTITINAAAGVATVTVPASSFGNVSYFTLASVSSNTSLPLQLTAFSGMCKDQAIQLKWATASPAEEDFIVERSQDKTNFTAVGTVSGNGARNHSWTDLTPLPGAVYYRLKSIQDNGMALYSSIVQTGHCNKTGTFLSTNPVTKESTLMLQLSQNSTTDIRLYDLMGRRYDVPGLTGQRSRERGVHYLPVNVPGAPAGMYLLHVVINDERHVFRVLKQ